MRQLFRMDNTNYGLMCQRSWVSSDVNMFTQRLMVSLTL